MSNTPHVPDGFIERPYARPYGLRPETDYYPRPRKGSDDIMWVFLRTFYESPDNVLWVEYQPAYIDAPWLLMPARAFRSKYLRMESGGAQ